MTHYLSTDKSIMISSPAGSGKTEKLARRYIALLQNGAEVEKILAITFTDKAAAEMKQRILKILRSEDTNLFHYLLGRIPLMRVTTIHSFCATLLRRFAFEAGIDPGYSITEAIDADMAWDRILFDVLMDTGSQLAGVTSSGPRAEERGFILQTLGEKGFRGLNALKDNIDYLYQKRPFSLEAQPFVHHAVMDTLRESLASWPGAADAIEGYAQIITDEAPAGLYRIESAFLTKGGSPRKRCPAGMKGIHDYADWALRMHECWIEYKRTDASRRTKRLFNIFQRCMETYSADKKAQRALDYSDLEYLSYRMLTDNPEWANILYAFDERTDHLLVDEFQDTNFFQWAIINKLTEEWRSGIGAKRAEGVRPTLFLVGDEKQSVYFFRGANVQIFHEARQQMQTWLGEEFFYEEARENYRSLPVIIDFANHLFSKIMHAPTDGPPWMTRYSEFSACRSAFPLSGTVEIMLLDKDDVQSMTDAKEREADALARAIAGLTGVYQIMDRETQQTRAARYADIAILLRKRTHLKTYEDALSRFNIPYVAVKGIGFYQETEIAVLRALVYFLSNPCDDYSLYVLLKSPLFRIPESEIIALSSEKGASLFERMHNSITHEKTSPELNAACTVIEALRQQLSVTPLALLIERSLISTGAWKYFHKDQERANVRKFINIVERLEADGRSLMHIRDFLERTKDKDSEPKANVNAEGMDAVRIMTIHAAKGLEFPVVFVPGIEEPSSTSAGDSLVYEHEGLHYYKSVSEASVRGQDADFQLQEAREEEEIKRLFYVAVTRASDALFLLGHYDERERSFLRYLRSGLGISKEGDLITMESSLPGVALRTEGEIMRRSLPDIQEIKRKKFMHHIEVIALPHHTQAQWKPVTESVDIRRRHGRDWLILGDVLHRIFEGISRGELAEEDMRQRALRLLKSRGREQDQAAADMEIIETDIDLLKTRGIWQDIILPREDSYAELPFVLEHGGTVYSGRIDRVLKAGDGYHVYDYKTFPVQEKEIDYLLGEYAFQLDIYKKAVRALFNATDVSSFIIFTHSGAVREVRPAS